MYVTCVYFFQTLVMEVEVEFPGLPGRVPEIPLPGLWVEYK